MNEVSIRAETNKPAIYPEEDAQTPENFRLVWPATPGVRYGVRQSTNLQSWSIVSGFPAIANGPVQQMPFTAEGIARFFHLLELDEQPPAIVNSYPQNGGFAVPRFAQLIVELSDVNSIDPASIRLSVGALGPFTVANTQLSFTNNLLTFDTSSVTALGEYGTSVQVTLVVADTLGNRGTNIWSFDLEVNPQVTTNLFVFGSLQAQRSGQNVGDIPTASLGGRVAPTSQNTTDDSWSLELVESNRLVIVYKDTPPHFTTNTYVCNQAPARPEDIFNRRVTAILNDLEKKRLALFTTNVTLEDMVQEGSATISGDSVILETSATGRFARALSVGGTVIFPRIGFSLDGAEFKLRTNGFEARIDEVTLSVGDEPNILRVTTEQLHCWLTPKLQTSLEITAGGLKRFEAIALGNLAVANILDVDVLLQGRATNITIFDLAKFLQHRGQPRPVTWLYLGNIGVIPVYASLGFNLEVTASAEARADLTFRFGLTQDVGVAFGISYDKPHMEWVNTFEFPAPTLEPFTAAINGEASLSITLKPKLEFLVYGLAGVSAGITPKGGIVFEVGTGQPLSGRLEADISLDLALAGPALDRLTPKELSFQLWEDQWHLFPDESVITFKQQPQSQTVQLGNSAYFSCSVAASQAPEYQWYYNGVPLPGQTSRALLLPSISYNHSGQYRIRASVGSQTAESDPATLTVVPSGIPTGMALIPAGPFHMGDTFNDGQSDERPVHVVSVSAFYMDRYEVTKALWDTVYTWAVANGFAFDRSGAGKGPSHPVQQVNWYDMIKWCNARSEINGLTHVYYTDASQTTVYKTGRIDLSENFVKWSANGYRLPTEAEWERAARGNLINNRFPWGNTITHAQANYTSSAGYVYDVSPTLGLHPTYATGVTPYTSPVGSFPPNSYGLYDMAGNVAEWC